MKTPDHTLASDTSDEVQAMMVAKYRSMTSLEKVQRIHDLIEATRILAMTDIHKKFPGISKREAQLRLAERYMPKDLLREAFGWGRPE